MKELKFSSVTGVLLYVISLNAHSIAISDEMFEKNHGKTTDVKGTIKQAYAPLVKKSNMLPFQAVGRTTAGGYCTATWLGEEGDKTYILTAAHCISNNNVLSAPWNGTFYDRNGQAIASGGVSYIHPYRINRPEGFGGASTDVSVIVANKIKPMLDDRGQKIQGPWLYDGEDEINKVVDFVGYGTWGTQNELYNDNYFSERRAWGQSYINGIWEEEHGIGASFQPQNNPMAWAGVRAGDSGSSWWQQQKGFWTIIATTNGQGGNKSTGARVSKYISWIKSIYPDVATLQDKITLTAENVVILPDFSRELDFGSVAYVVPNQQDAQGPNGLINTDEKGFAQITVQLKRQDEQQSYNVVFRAWRNSGCGETAMNNAYICENGSSALNVRYYAEDNADLPPGKYSGSFNIEAQGWEESSYHNVLTLKASIEKEDVTVNEKPIAAVKYPTEVTGAAKVTLDGTDSTDPEGKVLSYKWEQISGPAVAMTGANQSKANLTFNKTEKETDLRFRLIVNNGEQDSDAFDFTIKHKVDRVEDVEGTWKSSATYNAGDTVTWQGKTYKARWWSRGDNPISHEVWENTNKADNQTWNSGKVYNGGDTVTWQGKTYKARWWTRGNNPISHEVWENTNKADNQTWNSGKAYNGGERVLWEGHAWMAKWWTKGMQPGTDNVWEKVK
ncbi:carbohydrate-binding protein [Erwinia sp. HDF1-3R]|uniref:carbohydrate-binding protein n=1 Tax=Erwinia sp. HDF1-3R TaxID=3141543 RepID=UPI0031F53124